MQPRLLHAFGHTLPRVLRAMLLLVLLTLLLAGSLAAAAGAQTFTNPLRDGADPWVLYKDGYYYLTVTRGSYIDVIKSPTATGLATAEPVVVWRAPRRGPNSRDIWAPELHYLNGTWYIYYAATSANGSDANRRTFVLEAATADPQGSYIDRGKIADSSDQYAIDPTVYRRASDGALFFLWSGRQRSSRGPQNLYIAPMSSPLSISGPRVLLSTPTYNWEKVGWEVNEAPQVLYRDGRTFLVYSASGASTPEYCLGMLSLVAGGDLLRASSWSKSPVPVFSPYSGPEGHVYTVGHNSFFTTPDGREDWLVYHGKEDTDGTFNGRTVRMQRFSWNADGTPFFGHPIPAGVPLDVPSGDYISALLPDTPDTLVTQSLAVSIPAGVLRRNAFMARQTAGSLSSPSSPSGKV